MKLRLYVRELMSSILAKKTYRLAIVPKVPWYNQYAYAFGSQHDYFHTRYCLKKICQSNKIKFKIIYLNSFLKNYHNYDGVIFVGLNREAINFLKLKNSIDKFTWSFNQEVWVNERNTFENTDIIFEQSTRDLSQFYHKKNKVFYTPLAFQGNTRLKKISKTSYDVVFNGTLDRSRRLTAKTHRRDIILGLLEKGLSVINYNGRADKKYEHELLNDLKKYKNFKVVNKFGKPHHYNAGIFSLHLPFHELGSIEQIHSNWGMNRKELEDTNWLLNWDTFRCIGAKANIITFDCPEVRKIGLNESNCNFYKNDPENIEGIVNEVSNIVKGKNIKQIDKETWEKNTYLMRWNFILNQITKFKDVSKLNG